jgi:hypothetical protein
MMVTDRVVDIREWAILAIRNCCRDHPANQSIIAKLEKLRPADSPDLQELGMSVGFDSQGRVTISKQEKP